MERLSRLKKSARAAAASAPSTSTDARTLLEKGTTPAISVVFSSAYEKTPSAERSTAPPELRSCVCATSKVEVIVSPAAIVWNTSSDRPVVKARRRMPSKVSLLPFFIYSISIICQLSATTTKT